MTLEAHQQRVVEEYNQLANKLNALRSFLRTVKERDLSELEVDLLQQQYGIMAAYAKVLSERIELFMKDEE